MEPLIAGLAGLERAFIFGSWAARVSGTPGSDPKDVDVLLIGAPDRMAILKVTEEASRKLGREVNLQVVSADVWAQGADPFVKTVKSKPLVELSVAAAKNSE